MANLLFIESISGVSPTWSLLVTSSSGVAVGDHIAAGIYGAPSGDGGVYRVSAVPDATHITVVDDLKIGGGLYGKPALDNAQ